MVLLISGVVEFGYKGQNMENFLQINTKLCRKILFFVHFLMINGHRIQAKDLCLTITRNILKLYLIVYFVF